MPNKTSQTKKKRRGMFQFITDTVDKVFSQVYDGEPVRGKRRTNSTATILEEEVLFCKNNVCVHIVSATDKGEKHSPGYLCLKKIYRTDFEISDLMLSWVPNSLLTAGSTEEAEIMVAPQKMEAGTAGRTGGGKTEGSTGEPDTEGKTGVGGKTEKSSTGEPDIDDTENLNDNENENLSVSPVRDFETPLGDVFSINVIDMKTIKLFYTNPDKESGQFVIGSPENQYKVFHFHNNGLAKLTEIFDKWNGCTIDPDLLADEVGQQVYYVNVGEQPVGENGRDIHPEEGRYKPMNMISWQSCINQLGQIEDGYNFRKHVFFGSLSQEVRPDAWKFLMYYYPMHSSEKEREAMKIEKAKAYDAVHNKRLSLSGDDYEDFWKKVQFTVDKDVVRTDRSHPYYAGQDNPNIQKMRNILLNYAIYNPGMGYTQGMSDLVAPLLATLHDQVDSFWCFVGLMEFSMFATSPKDDSMEKSLGYLRELLRIMLPEFYMHCLCQDYDLNLLFAHRWLVLCFKREFISHEVLKIWEACWARYQTDYFHIFICVALVSLYGDVCLEKKQDADEILQYFTDMAMKFDGSTVLKEARTLLYKFRQLSRIPCTLRGLLSGKGVWDGGISPEVECASNHQRCCFEFQKKSHKEDNKDLVGKSTVENNGNTDTEDSNTPIQNRTEDFHESEIKIYENKDADEQQNSQVYNKQNKKELEQTKLCESSNTMIKTNSEQNEVRECNEEVTDSDLEGTNVDKIETTKPKDNDIVTELASLNLDGNFLPDSTFSKANIY